MAEGDKTPDTFASLYFSSKRPRAKQADLFGPPVQVPVVPAAPAVTPREVAVPASPIKAAVVERQPVTVRALVASIRLQLERQHVAVWVEGEISNCRPAASGHLYFTLKDGEAQLGVVMFRREAQLSGVRPKDGDQVELRGRISVYESRGQLQLIAETMELRGAGALEAAFKRLKAKLKAEGLFEEARKRALPAFPKCIGVVSSRQGAVIEDIVHVVRRRHARLNLLLYPAAMQGARCAAEVAAGIQWFNKHPERVDLIILARGGGSIEDLAGFNDEGLARVIAASALPVVSAIGHEVDFTIADFVADLRAATPSAAAEMVTAAQHRIEERVLGLERRVQRGIQFQMMQARARFGRLSAEAVLRRLRDAVSRRDQRIDELTVRLETALERRMRGRQASLGAVLERLRRQGPTVRLAASRRRLERADEGLGRVKVAMIATRLGRVERVTARLQGLSPVAVLSRGYALVYSAEGVLLRDAGEVAAGQEIRARLGRGSIRAKVEDITR
ncbi:exodeoxyribonuclease VII large subunit [Granulicella arctica]|uniref:exodeoxyribonuclease VII large subunit n=1 Tax=Granulicella arctica TaxID=940613 RepID=UPI0021E0B7EB|nr:exodeoxyribonuclease VII large subunit [Granulicella arctica]